MDKKLKNVCTRLNFEENGMLKQLCDETGDSRSEIMRQAIRFAYSCSESFELFMLKNVLSQEGYLYGKKEIE